MSCLREAPFCRRIVEYFSTAMWNESLKVPRPCKFSESNFDKSKNWPHWMLCMKVAGMSGVNPLSKVGNTHRRWTGWAYSACAGKLWSRRIHPSPPNCAWLLPWARNAALPGAAIPCLPSAPLGYLEQWFEPDLWLRPTDWLVGLQVVRFREHLQLLPRRFEWSPTKAERVVSLSYSLL